MRDIQCPSCNTRFSVSSYEEYLNKKVECGSCSIQFVVTKDIFVRSERKHHIPVRKETDLSAFSKTVKTSSLKQDGKEKSFLNEHLESLLQEDFSPPSRWKEVLNLLGWLTFLGLCGFLLSNYFQSAWLQELEKEKKMVLFGFICSVCELFFILSHKKFLTSLLKLILICSSSCLGIYLLTLSSNSPVIESGRISSPPPLITPEAPTKLTALEALKNKCRYQPIEEALKQANKKSIISSIWIEGGVQTSPYPLQEFFKTTLSLDQRPNYYVRKDGILIVIESERPLPFPALSNVVSTLGEIEDVYPEERLISVLYDDSLFNPLSSLESSALLEVEHPHFYQLNQRELLHFDPSRVSAAISRLQAAPQRFKGDIIEALCTVLNRFQAPRISNLAATCLNSWIGEDITPYLSKVNAIAHYDLRLLEESMWPVGLVKLLLRTRSREIYNVTLHLWAINPAKWESILIETNKDFGKELLRYLDPNNRNRNISLVRIMKQSQAIDFNKYQTTLKRKLDASYDKLLR